MTVLIISSLVSEAYKNLSADRISYFAYNSERDELQCIISKDIKGMCIPKTAGYVGQAFQTGKVINAKAVQETTHYKIVDEKVGYITKSVLCAPLYDNKGNKVGVFQAVNKLNSDCFNEEDEKRIQNICHILSMFINEGIEKVKSNSSSCNNDSFDVLNEIIDTIQKDVEPSLLVQGRHLSRLNLIKRDLSALASEIRNEESNINADCGSKLIISSSSMDTCLPSNLFTWDFNVIEVTETPRLCTAIMKLVESLPGLPEGLNLQILGSYVEAVSVSYNLIPFHNFQHAACVTHALFMFINEIKVERFLNNDQIFGLLLSAIVHDVDHPGNTNAFEVNVGSDLAIIYNDKSVLENHHCSTAFRLMRRKECAVLTSLCTSSAGDIRKTIVTSVLTTDMAVHFQMGAEIAQKASLAVEDMFEEEGSKLFLCSILLHTADLSNPYRRFDITQAWAKRVAKEFNNQVSMEKELGLPFLPYMETSDEISLCRSEIGFGSHVVMPYVKNLKLLFPELSYIEKNLSENTEKWAVRLAELSSSNNDSIIDK